MTDFSIHRNNSNSKDKYPYLINVQHKIVDNLSTRLAIPVIEKKYFENLGITVLNPEITIENRSFFALTQQMAAIPKNYLGIIVENTTIDRNQILAAIDFLITGF